MEKNKIFTQQVHRLHFKVNPFEVQITNIQSRFQLWKSRLSTSTADFSSENPDFNIYSRFQPWKSRSTSTADFSTEIQIINIRVDLSSENADYQHLSRFQLWKSGLSASAADISSEKPDDKHLEHISALKILKLHQA